MEGKLWLSIFLVTFFVTIVELDSCGTGSTSTVQVRLVDNSVPNAGRVEIGYKGVWKSVCDTEWYIEEANVICKMLGYNQGAAAAITGMTSADDAWLMSIYCQDPEATTIEQCGIFYNDPTRCANDRRAGVVCSITDEIQSTNWFLLRPNVAVRLVNGSTPNQGRVEVRYYGMWGAVCNTGWDLADGYVVCRMLNYSKASWAGTANVTGSGPVLLSSLDCRGSEASVETCPSITWGSRSCNTKKHAAVTCDNQTDAPSVSVRLVGGQNHYGAVEVSYTGTWRPVCDDTWDISDAHVVCRMLGYKAAYAALKGFRIGIAGLWMSGVACGGKENSISECLHRGWSNTQCPGYRYAGVVCKVAEDQGPNVTVRLVNGSTTNQGRVEVRYYGIWGTVCNKEWDLADAHVVCRMLNYSKASWAGAAKVKGSGLILLNYVNCRGNEKSLEHCKNKGWGQHDCGHSEDAGVKCEGLTQEESTVAVRLDGSDHDNIGFVEVNYNGTWIPVCDDSWDILDAHVICRMLGYKAALAVITRFSVGKVGLWMGGVECSGDEVSINECYHLGWTNSICYGNYHAGVMCQGNKDPPPVQIRLEDGSSPNSGRVSVRYGSILGTIHTKGLDINDAKVMCRMLGYPGASKVYSLKTSLFEVRPFWLLSLECNGTEKSIAECRHFGWGNITTCGCENDGAIMCKNPDAPQFQINGTNAITESTVVILFNDSKTTDGQLKRIHQVAVEKRETERFKSYEQPTPFVYNEVNATIATKIGNKSYITAEIVGHISNLTIGNGQYYHGYFNAPLEPESMYRVHVRIATMAMDGFTTKSPAANQGSSSGSVKSNSDINQNALIIGLAAAGLLLLCVVIGMSLCYALGNKKKENDDGKHEMIEIPRAKQVTAGHINPQFYEQ